MTAIYFIINKLVPRADSELLKMLSGTENEHLYLLIVDLLIIFYVKTSKRWSNSPTAQLESNSNPNSKTENLILMLSIFSSHFQETNALHHKSVFNRFGHYRSDVPDDGSALILAALSIHTFELAFVLDLYRHYSMALWCLRSVHLRTFIFCISTFYIFLQ